VEKTRDAIAMPAAGLLETPPIPDDLRNRAISLTDNARVVLQKRYLRRGSDGKPAENEQEMFWRVAYNVALAEDQHNGDLMKNARAFYDLLTNLQFFPNSPTFTGAGTPLGQLAACFVLRIDDDMGRSDTGIFQTLRNAALIQQTGGGNGFSFSRLRPKGAIVKSSNGQATGPVGFLRVYDQAFGEIAQGGSRRGANMSVLRVDHPDVREFITCKTDESHITNFNISVGITDAFMRALEADTTYDLINPQDGSVWETVRAREIFDLIVKQAHHNGEPGVLFLDAANRQNPVPHLYELESTNPCFIGSTRVATDMGLIQIEDLANLKAEFMVATDNRAPLFGLGNPKNARGVAFRQSSPAWKTRQDAEIVRVNTKHGYSVTVTPDHKFLTPLRGYVAAKDLQSNEQILLQSGEGAWSKNYALPNAHIVQHAMVTMAQGGDHASGAIVTRRDFAEQYANVPTQWTHELGVVLGWLVGDGWISPNSGSPVGMVFGAAKDEAREVIHEYMRAWFGDGHMRERESVYQLTYGRLPLRFFESLGIQHLPAHEKRVPKSVWVAPREAVVGFLQGLFTADGTVNLMESKGSCSVRLSSSSKSLLEEVQLLLLNFGIVSKLHLRRESGLRNMPDGKGGYKQYEAHADYELLIDKANRDKFVEEIGFIDSAKQSKVAGFIARKARTSNREDFVTSVVSIENAGYADVYDLTERQTSSLIANGIVAHNCGEQFLGPFENCCLGSINLVNVNTPDGKVDWALLQQLTETSTRFLDDVVTANKYVPAVPQLQEAAHAVRRIGLGIMGLGDLMYKCGIRYGSEEGQEFAGQVMEFVRFHAMKTSVALAKERGPFTAIKGSIYDQDDMKWQPPKPLFPYSRDWGRPALNWTEIVSGIKQYGIRNGCQTTVAPTGTIATVSGCEAYGCEPVFALAYTRHVNDKGQDLKLQYTSPLFQKALEDSGLNPEQIKAIVEQVNVMGSCQDVAGIPERVRHTFVVSSDISVEEHIRMQAAMQAFVDNAISKTVNAPNNATLSDVEQAYMLGWKLGCKGMTVYVTGSREKVVLETHATAQAKQKEEQPAQTAIATTATPAPAVSQPAATTAQSAPMKIFGHVKKSRPRRLAGRTYQVGTPLGKTYITVNENGEGRGQPFEIFTHTSKAGSETAAVSEAIGRLISLVLRVASPISPRERLNEIVQQLVGIGGGRSSGFGAARVRSLPDGVAQALQEYLDETSDVENLDEPLHVEEVAPKALNGNGHHTKTNGTNGAKSAVGVNNGKIVGDLCPECGEATLINEEGCRKCYTCGYSEC
jgi:ribonucleoside-diphosphate reductase alpha chain